MKSDKNNKQKKTSLWSRFRAWIHTASARSAGILAIGGLLAALVLCLSCAPERYSLTVGSIARETIIATKDVEDTIGTAEAKRLAAAAVDPSYHLEEGVSDTVLQSLASAFEELRKVQQYGLTLRTEEDTPEKIRVRNYSEEEIAYAQGLLDTMSLSRYQITTLLRTETADFDTMVSQVTTAVSNSLNSGIRENRVSEANATIRQIVGYRVDLSLTQNILPTLLTSVLKPNLVIDQETTAAARRKAEDAVEPVIYLQGQNIVLEGEIIRQNQYEMVRSLGLLQDDSYDLSVYGGAVVLAVMGMGLLILLLRVTRSGLMHEPRKTAVLVSVMVVSVSICALMTKMSGVFTAPVAMAGMLCTVLLGWQSGVSVTACMCVLMMGLTAGDSTTSQAATTAIQLMTLIGGMFSVGYLKGRTLRMGVMLCGLMVGLLNMVCLYTITLLTSLDTAAENMNALWALAGGTLSGAVSLGLQAVFESIFVLATPSKLLELGNPNHPLLRRLLLEAPGTYHHSIVVANLAEAAAERIGANPILARTGAYFHDVGKLKRPQYFKENQVNENPLNATDAYVSAAIVTSHTKDGLQLAQKYRLPVEIQKIIIEHHGDTPVMYFYHKATQLANGQPVDISDFRYAGPRPSSKEAAIVMLADTIEAAIRSMTSHTPQLIQENIERLVQGKLEDGQLSDCPLSLKDIDGICEAFNKVLSGVYHERIEYPKTEVPKRGAFMVDTAEMAAKEESAKPAKEESAKPAKEEPAKPAKEEPAKPAKEEPAKPAKEEPAKPARTEEKPAAETEADVRAAEDGTEQTPAETGKPAAGGTGA